MFHRVDDDDDDDVSNSVRLGAPNNTKALDTIDPAAKVVVLFRGNIVIMVLDDDDVNDDVNDVNDTDDVNVVRILLLLLLLLLLLKTNASFVVCVSSAFVCVKKGFLLREFSRVCEHFQSPSFRVIRAFAFGWCSY